MRKLISFFALAFLFTAVSFSGTWAQSTANYTFTTATNASLTDMTVSTQIVAAGQDDAASTLQNIGFDFYMMGTRYTSFSANSNGFIRLGAIVATAQYTLGTAATTLISSFGSDELTQVSAGGVFYKMTGTAPNRILTVEFRNMTVIYDGAAATGDATSQVRLYENTGIVELVYGSVNRNSSTGYMGGMEPQYVGFSTGSAANTVATVTTSTGVLSTAAATSNQYTLGAPVAELTSAAQGSRKIYTFTPPTTSAPTSLSFTGVTPVAMTLNWADNAANEVAYVIYRSDDGGATYNYITSVAANSTSSAQSGLSPNRTYFWRVYAVTEGALSSALQGSQATNPPGSITSNGTGGGLWSAGSTWVGGVAPTGTDSVTILGSDVVTVDATPLSCLALSLSGTLVYDAAAAKTFTVVTNATINSGGNLLSAATGTVLTHVFSVGGNLTNNGTINFSTNTNTAGANLTFTGAANNNFTGSGNTNLRTMTVNKVANTNILEMNLSNLTIQGVTTDVAGFLTITSGTLKISGTNTITNRLFTAAAYTIPAAGGLWMNNPNFTVPGQNGSSTCSGIFRMTQGTYNSGTATGNAFGLGTGAIVTVEGGAINCTGRFAITAAANVVTYTQTAGTITVCTVGNTSTTLGNFDMGTSASSLVTISGGTIISQLASGAASGPRDFRNQAGTQSVTGGTLQLGNALSGAAKTFNITGVMPNVVLTNTTANHLLNLGTTINNWYNSSLNFTINTGNVVNFSNTNFFFEGSTLTNNGTLTHTGASSAFYIASVGTDVNYTGTGVVTAATTVFIIEIDADKKFIIDPAVSNISTNYFVLFSGGVTNSNKLTFGNGGATTMRVQIGNTTTPDAAGTLDAAPVFNLGTGGQIISYLRTGVARTTGFEVNPTRVLNSMTIDPDAGQKVILNGGDLQVTTSLTLTTGSMDLSGNTLTLGNNTPSQGTLTGTVTSLVNGKFKRWIVAGTAIDFPIGTTISTDLTTANPTKDTKALSNVKAANSGSEKSVSEQTYFEKVGQRITDVVTTDSKSDTKTKLSNKSTGGNGVNSPDALTDVSRKVTVNFTAAPTTPGTLTAEWVSTPGGSNGLPLVEGAITVNKTADDGFWRFTAADGLAGGTYDITATGTSINGISDFTTLVLLKRSSAVSPWTLDGTHVTTTGSNTAPVLSRTGITSGFSDFVIGGNFAQNPLPVELASFTSAIDHRNVSLNWSTTLETNNAGFDIERKTSDAAAWSKVGFVAGAGNSTVIKNYTFSERNLATGNYSYRLKQMDNNGNFAYHNLTNEVIIGLPTKFDLSQNYPNPFNPSTKINFDLPFDSKVQITLFDMTGRQVATILNANQTAGYQTVSFNASNLSSGAYFYQINATGGSQSFVKTMKMMLVK